MSLFQLLPAEIRCQIYQKLIIPHRVEILRLKDKRFNPSGPVHYRLYHRQLAIRDTKSQRVVRGGRRRPSYNPLPLAFIFSCRLIYCETIVLLYSTTQFVFNSTKSVARFLKTTHADSQASIRHIELNHVMYNEPRLTAFRTFKFRSDMVWFIVCENIAKAFTSLSVLHFRLTIYDGPIRLEVGERWSFPLLVFNQEGNLLDYVNIQLITPRFDADHLRAVGNALEQELMKPEAYQIREDERFARSLGTR